MEQLHSNLACVRADAPLHEKNRDRRLLPGALNDSKHLPVQAPILNRFGDVRFRDPFGVSEVGDGSGYSQDLVVGAGAEAEGVRGGFGK